MYLNFRRVGGGGWLLKSTYAQGSGTSKTYESVQGGGGEKSIDIEHTYFLNGP